MDRVPNLTAQLERNLMKPDTAIAKQMILDANKNCVFAAGSRLVAR
jgi:hypothetical protein